MAKSATRKTIPAATRNSVLAEFNHLCAICGAVKPQIHHIDENNQNNEPQNLLPLCPSHHLTDHHNPTSPVDQKKIALFRIHKDPLILSSKFQPVFKRLRFLLEISKGDFDSSEVSKKASDLVHFIYQLKMGEYYGHTIHELVTLKVSPGLRRLDSPDDVIQQERREKNDYYFEQLSRATPEVMELAVESIRYQPWEAAIDKI